MKVERLEIDNPEVYEMTVRNPTIVKESEEGVPLYEDSENEVYFKMESLKNFTYIRELLVSLKIHGTFLLKEGERVDEEGKFKFEKYIILDDPVMGKNFFYENTEFWKLNGVEVPSHDNKIEELIK